MSILHSNIVNGSTDDKYAYLPTHLHEYLQLANGYSVRAHVYASNDKHAQILFPHTTKIY